MLYFKTKGSGNVDKTKDPCKSKGPNMVKWLFSNPYKFSNTENGRQIQKWLWVLIPLTIINIVSIPIKLILR